jgi:hypothetical protein
MEEGLPFCKICLEIDMKNNLISPCLCTSCVHKSCLDNWRLRFDVAHVNRIKCTDCKGEYQYDIKPEVTCYHHFIIYCYILGFASIMESAACEMETSMISNDGDVYCYFLLLPNHVLCLLNLCYSVCIGADTLSKKLTMVFAMVFNTIIFLTVVYMFGSPTYIMQPIVVFFQCMVTIKNIRKYVVSNKLDGWQLLENEE